MSSRWPRGRCIKVRDAGRHSAGRRRLRVAGRTTRPHAICRTGIPEAAPYVTAEAQVFPPPYEEYWTDDESPGPVPATATSSIFDEWNGSMMANAWRDPAWRAAFLLSARQMSTHGNCDTPAPPDGTAKARAQPVRARRRVRVGVRHRRRGTITVSRPGSLVDGVLLALPHADQLRRQRAAAATSTIDAATGLEHAPLDDPKFNPTSDNGTGLAFATLDSQFRNTESGKAGVVCMVCHSLAETREHAVSQLRERRRQPDTRRRSGAQARVAPLAAGQRRTSLDVPDPSAAQSRIRRSAAAPSGCRRTRSVSPSGSARCCRRAAARRRYHTLSGVFGQPIAVPADGLAEARGLSPGAVYARRDLRRLPRRHQPAARSRTRSANGSAAFRSSAPIPSGPSSRYADRPGNRNFDPAFKRDCQTCHMQQDYGQPGTAQTLYKDGAPLAAAARAGRHRRSRRGRTSATTSSAATRYVPRLIGKDVDATRQRRALSGAVDVQLLVGRREAASTHNAFWTNADRRRGYAQQARLAWDRLRNVLELTRAARRRRPPASRAPLAISVANTGSGHNFPTGFPEGRIAWVAVHALRSRHRQRAADPRRVLEPHLRRRRQPDHRGDDRSGLPGLRLEAAGGLGRSVSPIQFKAVATLGDGCPTLELAYAAPLQSGDQRAAGCRSTRTARVIDAATNPRGLPQFRT